ncbi:hypothetical protein PVAND_003648 [Polypedilum vanderplanki]|uniref:Uncharacterized protein n=1 Tax=Polypedilum vanderplanki TaxID=319348 RepID=A0A9J6BVR0_POLVA|nr:hypothetical protein PVAND_003648 [Polypedilum vanderplanki]
MMENSYVRRNFSISRSGKFKRRIKERVSITEQDWLKLDDENNNSSSRLQQELLRIEVKDNEKTTLGRSVSHNDNNDKKNFFTSTKSNSDKNDKKITETTSTNEFVP